TALDAQERGFVDARQVGERWAIQALRFPASLYILSKLECHEHEPTRAVARSQLLHAGNRGCRVVGMNTTWRKEIECEMSIHRDSFANVEGMVANSYHESEPFTGTDWLDDEFDNGYGGTEGHKFTLWTKSRVYFPINYDGSESCGSVPRNPCA